MCTRYLTVVGWWLTGALLSPATAMAAPGSPRLVQHDAGFSLWRNAAVQQGGVLAIAVTTTRPCAHVSEGSFGEEPFRLFGGDKRWWAVLPVPVGRRGDVELVVRCDQEQALFVVPVQRVSYGESHVTVDAQFDKPPPARATSERAAMRRAYEGGAAGPMWRRSFVRPTDGVETSAFGVRRFVNGKPSGRHYGLDYNGAAGDAVRATNTGLVVLVGEDYYFTGNSVLIDHGNDLFTVYYHLSQVAVTVGTRVRRGEVIGAIGATGRATGPHLHFGVRLLGHFINPSALLTVVPSRDLVPEGS